MQARDVTLKACVVFHSGGNDAGGLSTKEQIFCARRHPQIVLHSGGE